MGAPIDLTGQRFGMLTVIEETSPHITSGGSKQRQWVCHCDCGNRTITTTQNLRSGDTRSCGCYEKRSKKENATIHGESRTKLHNIWKAMRKRCRNENSSDYKYYGGKGVSVCDDWNDYASFRNWALSNGFKDGLTIDRIDSSCGYSPENCRWISIKEQSNNRTNNRRFTHNGENHTIAEWSEITHIPYHTLYMRLYHGKTIDESIAMGA